LTRVVEDPEVDVQARGAVPGTVEHVPERERVLPAGHRDQHRLVAREHAPPANSLQHMMPEKVEEVGPAEGRVVTPEVQHGPPPALPALHWRPPEMTGRSSTTSSSATTSSTVSRSCPRITRTVSGRTPSSARSSRTRRRPWSSTSRP